MNLQQPEAHGNPLPQLRATVYRPKHRDLIVYNPVLLEPLKQL